MQVKKFPAKVQSTFDGLFQSYKKELIRGVGDEREGDGMPDFVFNEESSESIHFSINTEPCLCFCSNKISLQKNLCVFRHKIDH